MKTVNTIALLILTFSLSAQTSEDVLSTWDKHVEMNHLILNFLPESTLLDVNDSTSRNVGEQFAHMHNVRMMWLGKSELAKGMDQEIDAAESRDKAYLISQLKASDALIRKSLEESLKKNQMEIEMTPIRFMGYLISHESHTRGQIVLALKNSGHQLPPNIAFGIWGW